MAKQHLSGVGERLRVVRRQRGLTLAQVGDATGISTSTLSRLESGQRRATLELLLALAGAYQVPIDDLVGAPPVGDPRIRLVPRHVGGRTMIPLSQVPGAPAAFKILIPAEDTEPSQQTHEGYEWLYVLSGTLRLVLGDNDLTMRAGEAAEFDTRLPHWIGAAGAGAVEVLILFGPQGERAHVRARPSGKDR